MINRRAIRQERHAIGALGLLCGDITIAQIRIDRRRITLLCRAETTAAGLTQNHPITKRQIGAIRSLEGSAVIDTDLASRAAITAFHSQCSMMKPPARQCRSDRMGRA